jgi:predicted transcriptional regulator
MQFLSLQAAGKTQNEIAAECFVSPNTVRNTIVTAQERLGAKSTLQAVVFAIAYELLACDSDGNVTIPEQYNYLYHHAGRLPDDVRDNLQAAIDRRAA